MFATKYTDRLGRTHLKEQLTKMLPHIEKEEQERKKRANNLCLLLSKETEKLNELVPVMILQ